MPKPAHTFGVGHNSNRSRSTYAVLVDLDIETLKEVYPSASFANAYSDIERALAAHGFDRMQGGMYIGNESVNAVTCVMATIDLKAKHPWFTPSVRDLRMLRIEENNDLKVALTDNEDLDAVIPGRERGDKIAKQFAPSERTRNP